MENFTNEPIDITTLPRYEAVHLNALQPKYWNVILLNIAVIFLIIGIALAVIVYFVEEIHSMAWLFGLVYVLFLGFTFFLCRISFHKRGFAFREQDVIYRSGILATNTMIIPYNRVQHVALHEGFISRYFDLAKDLSHTIVMGSLGLTDNHSLAAIEHPLFERNNPKTLIRI
jgi:membrane protein YdbS with pleckstrin-like domain